MNRIAAGTRLHLTRLTLAAAAAALPLAAVAAEPSSITLNLAPLANSSQQQDMSMKMTMNMSITPPEGTSDEKRAELTQRLAGSGMPMVMTTVMRQRLDTGAKDAEGRIPVSATMETLKSEMRNKSGQVQQRPIPVPKMSFTATLKDDRFEDIDLSGMEGMSSLTPAMRDKMFKQIFDWAYKFNGTTLKLGESVELPLDMELPMPVPGAASAGKFNGRYTLTQIKQGVAFMDVDVDMTMDLTVPLPPQPAASGASAPAAASPDAAASSASAPAAAQGKNVTGTMTGKGKGKMQIRLKDRLQLQNAMDMNFRVNMQMPDGNAMAMDMGMVIDAKGKALPVRKVAPVKKADAKG
ncbi:MAG: hypothetical protein ABW220_16615 [Burkholderiaceae bacterium]